MSASCLENINTYEKSARSQLYHYQLLKKLSAVDGEEVIYRLITDLMEINKFPALVLAQEYHSRWEIENTLDELKTHLNGRKTIIRSKNPREVVQEIYGWLLAHYCVRATMFDAATEKGVSPLRISFTGSLKVIRRAVPLCQSNSEPELNNHYYSWILAEIGDLITLKYFPSFLRITILI